MTEGKYESLGQKGVREACNVILFYFIKYMSVISYTGVCFISVAAVFVTHCCSVQQQLEDGLGWAVARSVICTRCHNGQVYRGGICVGHHPQGRRGD